MQTRYFPWLDRAGRLSIVKLVVFVGLFLPGLYVALALRQGWLGPKPVTEAIHEIGQWAVKFLLLSLLVTPLRRVGQWVKLIAVRRMLGLAALAYAMIHLTLYLVDQHFDLLHVASEIVLRFYLTIGFVALLGLAALGVTSTDAMIKRLGGKAWNRLHMLVYGVAALGLLHFLLQSKIDVTEAVVMSGFFVLLMGWRLLQQFGAGDGFAGLAGLAVFGALATTLLEAGWYHARNGIALSQVLRANLSFDGGPRPAWIVLFAGLALLAVRLSRRLWAGARRDGRPAAPAGIGGALQSGSTPAQPRTPPPMVPRNGRDGIASSVPLT